MWGGCSERSSACTGRTSNVLKASGTDIPFIIVSGTIGEERAVQAMKAGASDYLVKGRLGRLIPVIQRELADVESRRARRVAELAAF
jgi:sigma-B regulation protein RsbU (phosphoserine phosphatase)